MIFPYAVREAKNEMVNWKDFIMQPLKERTLMSWIIYLHTKGGIN